MEHINDQKKSKALEIFKKIFMLLFPIIKILQLNSLLKKAERIDKNPWYSQTRKRNLLIGFLTSLPIILSTLLAAYGMSKDTSMFKYLNASKVQFIKFDIFNGISSFYNAFFNPETLGRIIAMCNLIAIGVVITLILGFIVSKKMKILKESKLLVDQLKRNGIFNKEDNNRIALATPRGFLIDITGTTPQNVKASEVIWQALNIKINDYIEDSEKRSLVFFQKKYELKKSYIYEAKDIEKLLGK